MFDSLSDQIRHDEELEVPRRERIIRYFVYAVVSILVFIGLYMAVRAAG